MPDNHPASEQDLLAGAAIRLKMARSRAKKTLNELSAETGISVSTLSRLESGQRKPTLELLLKLARVHGVSLDELVGDGKVGDPRIRPQAIEVNGRRMLPLSRQAGGIQAYQVLIPAGPREEPAEPVSHEGYEWLYVLSGKLRLLLGEHDLVLKTGEVAEFDTHTPHWIGRAEESAVEYLTLFGPQGERLHVRARPRGR
ncbi:transcriptional regulator with XRE-family HTH domain [Psychromicrobium silvestre]|uniref:Transcriptional regulator with XRE-family HTH domain n=1 Tax=Psychromicrobium silvestre TaxID=1645614 RepID=A0A7Y9LTL0_9MICC|nr:XRE family transcriptional regulator [Psychromicrobium silvestre]NYE95338.1 transcriptional regulator with XRE-family HTH domain [Psychromicrobium silvestre]